MVSPQKRTFLDGYVSSIRHSFNLSARVRPSEESDTSSLGCSLPATAASRPDAKAPLDKKWWPMNLSDVKGLKVCLVVKKIGYDWVCCLISFQNALLSALLAFFSCPWVDRIYCDNNFMIKIETKCRRRGISFFSVSDPNASATPQVESTRSRRGCAPSDECKSNAPSRPHAHFDSSSIWGGSMPLDSVAATRAATGSRPGIILALYWD